MRNKQYKQRTITCVACGTHVTKHQPNGRKYCSLKCYRNTKNRPQRQTGKVTECDTCKREMYRAKSQLLDVNFCSVECHNVSQQVKKVCYKCIICSNVFLVSPSVARIRSAKYCSIQCRDKCPVWKEKSVIAGNVKQAKNKGPNKLEAIGNQILLDIRPDAILQYTIDGRFTVDAFLEKEKIAIQWDGEYWHGYPNRQNQLGLDNRQKARVRLDVSQDAYMKKAGIKVLRFWEREIKNEGKKVREDILSAIHEAAR